MFKEKNRGCMEASSTREVDYYHCYWLPLFYICDIGGLMGITHISKANIGAQFITLTNNGEPNWFIIPSAGRSSKSQSEFVNGIKELARKNAKTTNKTELEYIHLKRTQLCAEYMSDVSPDRKALYQQAKNALRNQGGNPKCRGIDIA